MGRAGPVRGRVPSILLFDLFDLFDFFDFIIGIAQTTDYRTKPIACVTDFLGTVMSETKTSLAQQSAFNR